LLFHQPAEKIACAMISFGDQTPMFSGLGFRFPIPREEWSQQNINFGRMTARAAGLQFQAQPVNLDSYLLDDSTWQVRN
jgi:hypothetical protein